MKFCSKCGNQMDDDMVFCQQCGTKVLSLQEQVKEEIAGVHPDELGNQKVEKEKNPKEGSMRAGMKIWMILCFVFAGIYFLLSLAESMLLSIGFFFGVLGVLFLCLAKTPKRSKFLFGKQKGIRKSLFVCLGIALAFVLTAVVSGISAGDSDLNGRKNVEVQSGTEEKVTLQDVEQWYQNEMPKVSQSLMNYAKNVNGISSINVTESKFLFGEKDGWYDCHYTYYFTCKVNGEKCIGEARAFRKYKDEEITWFHFEIVRDSDWSVIVEEYNKSVDLGIESYYKELLSFRN